MHTYIHTYIRTYVHTYIRTYIHTYIRLHEYLLYTYRTLYIHVCARVHCMREQQSCTHTPMHLCIYIGPTSYVDYLCTHTHTSVIHRRQNSGRATSRMLHCKPARLASQAPRAAGPLSIEPLTLGTYPGEKTQDMKQSTSTDIINIFACENTAAIPCPSYTMLSGSLYSYRKKTKPEKRSE